MSMKCTSTILLALLSVVFSFSLLPAGEEEPAGWYVITSHTPVLKEPDKDAAVIASLSPNTRVKVVGTVGDYLKIESLTGRPPGYISRKDAVPIQSLQTVVPAQSSQTVMLSLMDFENKSGPNLGSEWDFLKQEKGPSSDPLSNGLRKRLAEVLAQTERFAVIDQLALERKTEVVATKKPAMQERREETLPPPGWIIRKAEELPRSAWHLNRGPHFFVYCSATLHEDLVTIEVRLLDPRTMKLIKATAIEGRPEDLSRFRLVASGEESPAEKAVQVAIIKAVKRIEENTLVDANPPRGPEWVPTVLTVVVKASAANVKKGPSIQSATLITVRQGTMLEKVGEEGGWVKVKLSSGEMGWIYGDLVE